MNIEQTISNQNASSMYSNVYQYYSIIILTLLGIAVSEHFNSITELFKELSIYYIWKIGSQRNCLKDNNTIQLLEILGEQYRILCIRR